MSFSLSFDLQDDVILERSINMYLSIFFGVSSTVIITSKN